MTSSADSPYRHYTASEIEAANDTDLPALLSSLGYHVRRVGRFYTTLEMDSLRVKDRRIWYRYSESIGGDAVAFLRRFHGMSFPEAVHYLLIFNGHSGDSILPRQSTRPPPQRRRPVLSFHRRTATTSAYVPTCVDAASPPASSAVLSRWACSMRTRTIIACS